MGLTNREGLPSDHSIYGTEVPVVQRASYPRQAYLARLPLLNGTPCYVCLHPRSSHSLAILSGRCHVPGCTCAEFMPICGCGHLLCEHEWGTAEAPWACCQCVCKQFGARQAEQLGLL